MEMLRGGSRDRFAPIYSQLQQARGSHDAQRSCFEPLPHQPARGKRRPGHQSHRQPTMGEIIAARFSRRGFLKGSLAVSAIAATVSPMALLAADDARAAAQLRLHLRRGRGRRRRRRTTSPKATTPTCCCAGAIRSLPTRRTSTRRTQTAEAQAKQFGYNNDYRRLSSRSTARPSTACWWSTTNTPTRI